MFLCLQEEEIKAMQLKTNMNNDDLPLKDEWDRLVAKRDYGVGRRTRYGMRKWEMGRKEKGPGTGKEEISGGNIHGIMITST